MTRIIAGNAKGRELKVPPRDTRPTSARVKEAVFSRLESWNAIDEARVLDLYAGSGALGLEALSRGAYSCDFVEHHPPTARMCQTNARSTRLANTEVHVCSVSAFLNNPCRATWDLVFIDPPYDVDDGQLDEVIEQLSKGRLGYSATIVVERAKRSRAPHFPSQLYTEVSHKTYGDTVMHYACYQPEEK
ncbi:MAG: 16S rRNA (guanine(966)-N(2))-methyltransferase RsmD [Actinomycetaceae bacterium]|nr:16S rRNA (guanine(966)-N(2))-methyltransferase RsmD [Actinomycetaceae bacterium]